MTKKADDKSGQSAWEARLEGYTLPPSLLPRLWQFNLAQSLAGAMAAALPRLGPADED